MVASEILPTGISRLAINAVVVITIITFLAIVLALLRFKLRERGAFGTDDYVLMVSLVFLILQLVGQYMRKLLPASQVQTHMQSYHLNGWDSQTVMIVADRFI
jgi:hypothetical protein